MCIAIPDDMKWSFSKQALFDQCPLAFKLQYLDKLPQEQNAYASYGTFCHSLLERWAKGELLSFELADVYASDYDEQIKEYFPPFPRGLAGKYYDEGLAFFNRFDGFGDGFDVLAVEDRFEIDIHGNAFVGVADLVLREQATGDIIVIDHKSKSMQSMKKELTEYKRQLYVYAAYVKNRFGVFPKLLRFNMFRYDTFIDEVFDLARYEETLHWVADTIERIKHEQDWLVSSSGYFCKFICSTRLHCPIGNEIIHSTDRRTPT